jgi:hypothetical protein
MLQGQHVQRSATSGIAAAALHYHWQPGLQSDWAAKLHPPGMPFSDEKREDPADNTIAADADVQYDAVLAIPVWASHHT